jgi:hypothetical protein
MNLLTVDEVRHLDKSGDCIWMAKGLKNMLHTQGVEFILKTLFVKSTGVAIPTTYYVGLDNRSVLNLADILDGVTGEPSTFGYQRYSLNSNTGFNAVFDSQTWKAKSITLLFNAIGGSWGPVKNAFLTTTSGNQGYLISSVVLPSVRTLNAGEAFTFKISLGIGG